MNHITMNKQGNQVPTHCVKSAKSFSSFYSQSGVAEKVSEAGISLMQWQSEILRESLAVEGGHLHYKNVGVSVPRQNGKTEIVVARSLIGLIYLSESMVYSSYRDESAIAIYYRLLDIIELAPKSIRMYFPILPSRKSKEKIIQSIDPRTGKKLGQVRFITRKGGAGRGMTESLIFIDEAQDLSDAEHDALSGSLATMKSGQIWYIGTPEPAESSATVGHTSQKNVNSTGTFGVIRKNIAKGLPRSFWSEWGVQTLVPKTDREEWYTANPALGINLGAGRGITEDFLESRAVSDLSFAVEHLGFWSEQEKNAAIDITRWNAQKVDKVDETFKGGRVYVAVKSSQDDSKIEIVMAVRSKKSRDVYVEVVASIDMSTAWESEAWGYLKSFVNSPMCAGIIIDGVTASTQIKNLLIQAGKWRAAGPRYKQGKVTLSSPAMLSVACAALVGAVNERVVFHMGQTQLDIAVDDAAKRNFRNGAGFGFFSISGKSSAALLEAAALALSEASQQKNSSTISTSDSRMGTVKRLSR